MKLIDKDALVAEIEKLQSEIAEEKKLHEDNSMWYNGINHGVNLTKDILNDLKVKEVEEEPVSKDYRERYKKIAQSESFKEAYDGKSISEEEPSEIDFEQELYKAFGQVKDFTLGMQIAKWFYDMGKNSQEPVSENLEEAAMSYGKSIVQQACDELRKECGGEYTPGEDNVLLVAKYFKAGAKWQLNQIRKENE